MVLPCCMTTPVGISQTALGSGRCWAHYKQEVRWARTPFAGIVGLKRGGIPNQSPHHLQTQRGKKELGPSRVNLVWTHDHRQNKPSGIKKGLSRNLAKNFLCSEVAVPTHHHQSATLKLFYTIFQLTALFRTWTLRHGNKTPPVRDLEQRSEQTRLISLDHTTMCFAKRSRCAAGSTHSVTL